MTDTRQPTCPHCGREWHGLAITERMQQMRHSQYFDIGYRYSRDHTAVLCAGSLFIGPMPDERSVPSGFDLHATWRDCVATADPTVPQTGTTPERAVPTGLLGDTATATWHCPICNESAEVTAAQSDPNAFALALHDYARHVAHDHESASTSLCQDPVALAAHFGLPERGVLRDAEHRTIGTFAPGGTVFHSPATGRDIAYFEAGDTLDS